MARDAQETRRRLLAAAGEEFAERGFAGARVAQIVSVSGVNSALLYRYFGSKTGLFEAVFSQLAAEVVHAVPITPDDLAEYAGALFDYHQAHPEVVRLAAWQRLEQMASRLPESIAAAQTEKVRAVAAAQEAGLTARSLPAEQLLALVVHISLLGSATSPVPEPGTAHEVRRLAIVAAVRAITAP
ncbi:TetR family transcriptional regulator [Streptomyces sp. ZAF1911]|uniref:TetR/AcrR family transcriptional regulator n=1 Tax=Streptomyces sp. ZAF1911 TaxID=2944129 RepID=UPI00237BC979|nr:TetR family transcriptional regulator [Streptomyces sp. ZAF1911]MDD9381084.1 TetR family transcriptional regulator [Streptomyces sp. ZAF1911]